LNPSELAKAFVGHECVYCGEGTFYLISPTSLQCDKCEKVLDLTAESMLDDSDRIVVVVQTPFGETREFRVSRSQGHCTGRTAPEPGPSANSP
jgi:hypothetical protein